MGWLLMLIYNAFCMTLFRIFKIPLNTWTLSTAILGGIFIIGALLSVMNYQHPYSAVSLQYFQTTPVIPSVKGRIISVDVQSNTPLKTGDVLFQIDPEPFQNKIESLTAQLTLFTIDLKRAKNLLRKKVGSQRDVDILQAKVDDVQAKLEDAQYDLKQTTVVAATNGFVTQLLVHPGMYVVANPLRPAMVFVNSDSFTYIAWFRQNNLMRLEPGLEAEVAFDCIPGMVFSAEVIDYVPVLAEGEMQATGKLYGMNSTTNRGRIPVKIKITDQEFLTYKNKIPGGVYAQTAVYSEHGLQVAFLRRILIRMSSWMNYLFPFR